MRPTSYILLYVNDPGASLAFYEKHLGLKAHERFPTFSSMTLSEDVLIGLWSKTTVAPDVTQPGGCELAVTVPDAEHADRLCAEWQADGVTILQQPTDMVFGRTFLAADPDGHRLRVIAENADT